MLLVSKVNLNLACRVRSEPKTPDEAADRQADSQADRQAGKIVRGHDGRPCFSRSHHLLYKQSEKKQKAEKAKARKTDHLKLSTRADVHCVHFALNELSITQQLIH